MLNTARKSNKRSFFTKSYSAFTLIEMLIVMAIVIVLFAVGISSTTGIMATYSSNNAISTIKDDLRYAQRSAMFLDRDFDENWIYGIGIDFTDINNGNYRLFKWCSAEPNYSPDIDEMNTELPSWDGGTNFEDSNGHLPGTKFNVEAGSKCQNSYEETIEIKRKFTEATTKQIMQSDNIMFSRVSVSGTTPSYIVYESMTGRAFIYDANGNLLNYDPPSGADDDLEIHNTLDNLVIRVSKKRSGEYREINVTPVSGRIIVE